MQHKEKCVSSEEIFNGNVFKVYKDTVILENDKQVTREVVEHTGGVAILAVMAAGNILMVRQYRYGVKSELLELPAGKINKGEDTYECGMRELEEETGYKTDKMELLTELFVTPAYCSEKIVIYTADNLLPSKQNLDDDEFLSVIEIPIKEAVQMCIDGRIKDSKTIIGILTYITKHRKGI